jgi:hypothetical protein
MAHPAASFPLEESEVHALASFDPPPVENAAAASHEMDDDIRPERDGGGEGSEHEKRGGITEQDRHRLIPCIHIDISICSCFVLFVKRRCFGVVSQFEIWP